MLRNGGKEKGRDRVKGQGGRKRLGGCKGERKKVCRERKSDDECEIERTNLTDHSLPQVVQSLLSVLVEGYGCEFTQRDVQRMELIIMQKLDFKLTNYTAHDFLKIVSQTDQFL